MGLEDAPDFSALGEAVADGAAAQIVFALLKVILTGAGLIIIETWPV